MTHDDRPEPKRPQVPTKTTLSRDYIAAVALELVDDVGRDKFSMRKLGTELGVDPMAVYRYFDDQEALFDSMAEAIFAEIEVDSLPWDESWRELVADYSRRLRDTLLLHPEAVTIFATRPIRSPESIESATRMVELMTRSGFAAGVALQILRCVREFVIGHALTLAVIELGGQRRSRKPAPDSADYTLLAKSADAARHEEHFDLGLAAMLDGFSKSGAGA